MTTVIGVKFRCSGKMYYFDPENEQFDRGDKVIVETARGKEMGTVCASNREVDDSEVFQPLKPIIRKATEQDIATAKEYSEKEPAVFRQCKEKIREHDLEMKLVQAEYTFDGSKLIFYFTADGRVDFRELVKDLASMFHTRIELRQIGVRDEAMICGGVGVCGRTLCCCSYLNDFVPVSIKMAKEQNLSLNPTKISGVCGRLMCCLKNEQETYEYLNSSLPNIGETVYDKFEGTKGEVKELNVLKQKVKVQITLDDGTNEIREYHVSELTFKAMKKVFTDETDDAELQALEKEEEEELEQRTQEQEVISVPEEEKSEANRRRGNKNHRPGNAGGGGRENGGFKKRSHNDRKQNGGRKNFNKNRDKKVPEK